MAAPAASLTSAGAGKSGNPWAKLTASYCRARRVISRMTDSVKYSAFSESMERAVLAILSAVGLASAGLVMIDFEGAKVFTDEPQPVRAMREPHLQEPRPQKPCSKLWRWWQGRADRFADRARHCAPRSGRTHGSG